LRIRGVVLPLSRLVVVIFFACNVSLQVASATEIVVNKSVPRGEYSTEDLRAIFSMQKRFWPGQRQIKVFILPDSNKTHKEFVKNNLNMFPHQLRRVWDRMTYSGTGIAPVELSTEQEMIEKIATTPDSIGYLTGKSDNENIRVIDNH
jgi:hypothetical protein